MYKKSFSFFLFLFVFVVSITNVKATESDMVNHHEQVYGEFSRLGEEADYKINIETDGTVRFDVSHTMGSWRFLFFDSKGACIYSGLVNSSGNVEYTSDQIDLEVTKGVYTFKIINNNLNGKYNFKFYDYGFKMVNNHLVYYDEAGMAYGWMVIEGEKYYFDGSGFALNGFQTLENEVYYFDNYKASNGWKTIDGSKYYFDNYVAVDGWLVLDGEKYYLDNFKLIESRFYEIDGDVYLFDEGKLLYPDDINIDDYYFTNGKAANGFMIIQGIPHYYENHKRFTGYKEIEGAGYYFESARARKGFVEGRYYGDDYKVVKNGLYIGEQSCVYVQNYDYMYQGWLSLDGEKYYFPKDHGYTAANGWYDVDYEPYYFDNYKMSKGIKTIEGITYEFDESGKLLGKLFGWGKLKNGEWVYGVNGSLVNGWQSINGLQYYFKDYEMVHDWFLDENTQTWYFFNGGVMQRSDITINNITYLFDGDGIWRGYQPKWVWENNNYYYKDRWNNNVKGWQAIDGLQYKFREDGTMIRDWYLDEKTQTWYFFNGGVMQRTNMMINGKLNLFDNDGIWRGIA